MSFTRKPYASLENVEMLERHDEEHTRYNQRRPDAAGTMSFTKHKRAGWVEVRLSTQTHGKHGRSNVISFTMTRDEALELRDFLNEVEI